MPTYTGTCRACGGQYSRRNARAMFCIDCCLRGGIAPQRRAISQVRLAVQAGLLKNIRELPCVACGAPARAYDHRDYAKPLEVEPVCFSCNYHRGPAWPARNAA